MPHEPEHKSGTPKIHPEFARHRRLPFSSIQIYEPDDRLKDLALIVAQLADHLATVDPSTAADDLRRRAKACAGEIAG